MANEKDIYLVTAFNEPYLVHAKGYMSTIQTYSNVKPIVITLDFDIDEISQKNYENIEFIRVDSANVISPNRNFCLQHGAFLSALKNLKEDDILIFTDSDIKMQRAFSSEEVEFLKSFKEEEIGVNYNRSKNDYLTEEAERLKPKCNIENLSAKYSDADKLVTYNTGVVVATLKTYRKLYDLYNEYWPNFQDIFTRDAKQQWLLSYLIGKFFKVKLLPDIIHTHGKYPIQDRVKGIFGYKFLLDNQIVVFNHAVKHPAENENWRLKKKIRKLQRRLRRVVYFAAVIISALVLLLIYVLSTN